ncbi:unnamed protein product (mitochondrion) [Plasmodiophora brassicae]|uniref:L-threonine 3-dehydrogenase, mitochondrial n=1 Tax=Plasmodiophora brassicae TaxID=37360 RepID=A0A0G4IYM0_PLABS|nr:hypothetical protein PBRA_007840 [Plasmodiophora brassicae]SPR00230.1 unnamed protein product [Plasmodiophora brassicae]
MLLATWRRHVSSSAMRYAQMMSSGGYMHSGYSQPESATTTRVLVTGAGGQIGAELVGAFSAIWGADNVIASDIKMPRTNDSQFVYLDVLRFDDMARIVAENRITMVVHLASLLSAVGERNPQLALKLNVRGTEHVLELARANDLKVFIPSSIAAFGATTPREMTPDETITRPNTVYGITKVYSEMLGDYYARRYDVDFRSLRYPGIISPSPPGGGTTDYAVDIYFAALKTGKYTCFLKPDTELPMLYMPDCIMGTCQLLQAPKDALTRTTYNMTGMSFTPATLAASIQKVLPGFQIEYAPDFRQAIADTWPRSIDDSLARRDWQWTPNFDLDRMTRDMLEQIKRLL